MVLASSTIGSGRMRGKSASRRSAAASAAPGTAAARDEAPQTEASERRPGGDQHAAGAEAEERDADDQVGEVVEELEGEDARVADLEHDHREGHEEELEVTVRLRVGRHADARHS